MLTTKQPVFRKFWHAVMPLTDLAAGPKPFRLMGEDLVLFLDEQGQPAALADRCCHRTAKLSKGWVPSEGPLAGKLQCGYHGWTYDRTGAVVHIPQLAEGRTVPPDHRTTAYRCTARYGYAWVALEEPVADIPAIPEFDAPGWRTIFQFYETWHTAPLRALENSFDNSHFSFVHRATFGVADQPKPSRYELVDTAEGFYAETVIPAANPQKFHAISGVTDPITTRHMRNAYFQPFSRRLDIEYPSGVRHIIINCFTPIDDGRMQLCQWLFRNDTEADCPAQLLIDFDEEITREDKEILESTDCDAVLDIRRRGIEFSMESDRPGLLIRRKLMELLARHGEQEVHRGNAAHAPSSPAPLQAAA
ncbi:aromatic ring-hydroxylating oxygenase subunit alpha [Aquabacterium sp. J223]|uniref:aromatic ring-hydroxylating dioxygenase subunit alpha n=1 Tax=Aquabacterium sp. J223 TaxID=2898431 RepID=UPI0021ADA204|nr:aromatic ring-hydroxylating dioxygenase subunit alpha [Aquabacterium sp. J223]UUX95577.1 aromatic ring-hydroxylating dioxygenase subunit alpha [Aquabacterium sp. J223]